MTSLLDAALGVVFPVQHYTLSQGYGVINGRDAGGHKGIDMAAALGTPVLAAADGTISFEGPASGFGPNYVTEGVAGGLELGYGHMSKAYVRSGQQVKAGQIIGLVGSEGLSTGPHLHFQIKQNGSYINPLTWLQSKGAVTTAGTAVEDAGFTASPAGDSSGIAGAITGGVGSLVSGVLVAAVKGLLVLGGGAMVVLGVAATARRTPTVQRAESKAKDAASVAAMAA